jgi:hypothetical protein
LFWEVPRKQNDAVPQGAGKAPKRDPEKRTGYEPVDTHMNQKIPESFPRRKAGLNTMPTDGATTSTKERPEHAEWHLHLFWMATGIATLGAFRDELGCTAT